MQNPQQIRVGETVFVRQQGFGGWKEEIVESIDFVGDQLCAKFNNGWSYIGLGGDGIRRERPNVKLTGATPTDANKGDEACAAHRWEDDGDNLQLVCVKGGERHDVSFTVAPNFDEDDAAFAEDERVRITALHKSAPEVIWLQVDPEAEQFDGWEAQTWCSDRINETDVKYVRADLTPNDEVSSGMTNDDKSADGCPSAAP